MHLGDSLQLLSKFTPRKVWNAGKVISSYYVSKIKGKAKQWGLPMSISFEPTTSCNLRCPECPSGLRSFSRPTGMLDVEFFKNTINDLHKELIYLTFYFQGEPFLHPHFLDMAKYASGKGIYTATSTNAHYLDDVTAKKTVQSKLDRLIISIDGSAQETYEQYRIGGDLKKVIEGTKNIVRWKKELKSKTPHLIFQFLVVKPNEHQIEEVQQLAKELGVNELKLKTAQVYDLEKENNLIPENPKYARYKKDQEGNYQLENTLDNHCWKLWHSSVITWDGKVVPCCFDKDAAHRMGDLKETPFKELWQGDLYQNFRSAILKSRKENEICKNCSEGTKVWA